MIIEKYFVSTFSYHCVQNQNVHFFQGGEIANLHCSIYQGCHAVVEAQPLPLGM